MNSAPHLLPEDRPEFERAVDEVLRTAAQRPALAALGERLGTDRLRTMALSAAGAIAENAADEYARYVALRTELRRPSPDAAGDGPGTARAAEGDSETSGAARGTSPGGRTPAGVSLAGPAGEGAPAAESAGAGLLAMISVLVPLLAGTAAVIFLLLGYLLHVMTPEPSIAAPMRGAGWVFAVLAAVGTVVAMAELWLAALRNGAGARRRAADEAAAAASAAGRPAGRTALAEEVARARTAWREALLERGIVPFLAGALADEPGRRAPSAYAPVRDAGGEREGEDEGAGSSGGERTPRLGYSQPEFSSRAPSDGREDLGARPRYSSPDYSSPEYGGPEHPPE